MTPGALVRLKSGGPVMTVQEADGSSAVWCLWFGDGDQTGPRRYSFTVVMLEVIERIQEAAAPSVQDSSTAQGFRLESPA